LQGADTWVKKWVDYSSKYGLGYLLSNGSTGVFFNDSSKIILETKGNIFNYIEKRPSDKQEIVTTHTLTDFPKELSKKVTLLQHFKSYLEGDNSQGNKDINEKDNNFGTKKDYDDDKNNINININTNNNNNLDKKSNNFNNFIYVKKWMRTRHAIMFRLSNKIVQVCFQDHTEIILGSESRVVTYVNKKGERSTYPLSSALESNNYEMTKRLKYTKDILTHMLTLNNQNQNSGNTERVGNNDPTKVG
jgi:polo-like kinase 1